jgi:hypothetical protein
MRLPTQLYHQRGEATMPQGVLPFQYQEEKRASGLTGLAGLAAYLDLVHASGLPKIIAHRLPIRAKGQGWTDTGVIPSLILLNVAGGDCVEDLNVLEADEGLSRLMVRFRFQGMNRRERREEERRWRKEGRRGIASASATFRDLRQFHNEEEEKKRQPHQGFIPQSNAALKGLWEVHKDFIGYVQRRRPEEEATMDMDATLVETSKEEALWSYKGDKAYQPLQAYWHEQDLVVYSEFRDGNVPCGYRQTEVLERALEQLPQGVKKVYVRTDTQWAEVCFVPELGGAQKTEGAGADVPIPGDPRAPGPAAVAGVGDQARRASLSHDGGSRQGALQALWRRDQPRPSRRRTDPLAPPALWRE